jgi:predicted Zn-dependent protease with MMP-like domain
MENYDFKQDMIENYGVVDIQPLVNHYKELSSRRNTTFEDAITVYRKRISDDKQKQEAEKILNKSYE